VKVSNVTYKRTVSGGDYSNETVGVVVELADGENPSEAFERAKAFVDSRLTFSRDTRKKAEALVQQLETGLARARGYMEQIDGREDCPF